MKTQLKQTAKIFISLLPVVLAAQFVAEPCHAAFYRYSDLIIKDFDEMNQQVQARIRKAKDVESDSESIDHLRDALKLIFSRPNSDNMVAKLTPEVRRELVSFSAFEDTISSLAAEAIGLAKNEKATISQQSTALFILENLLAEIRPEIGSNQDLRRVIEKVAEANLNISNEVKKDRKIRSMLTTKNPSEDAKSMLKALPPSSASKKASTPD